MAIVNKRRRNARRSKYRPRTEAQKLRRQQLWEAKADERNARLTVDAEADLRERLIGLETALRDTGRVGIHGGRHSLPIEEIEDDIRRLGVLKARVERLENLWAVNLRKREVRGKIIIGGAILAELRHAFGAGVTEPVKTILAVLDRRVNSVRDRLTVKELLGDARLSLQPVGTILETLSRQSQELIESAPDFDALVHSAMAEESALRRFDAETDDIEEDASSRRQI